MAKSSQRAAETGEPADGADPDGTTRVDRPEPVGQED